MTIEAIHTAFGIVPLGTEELFPLDGESYAEIKGEVDGFPDGLPGTAHTIQALNDDQLAIFPYIPSHLQGYLERGEPIVLTREAINRADINAGKVTFRGRQIPGLSGFILWSEGR